VAKDVAQKSDTRRQPRPRLFVFLRIYANIRQARKAEMNLVKESDHRVASRPWQKRQDHYSREKASRSDPSWPPRESWRCCGITCGERGSVRTGGKERNSCH